MHGLSKNKILSASLVVALTVSVGASSLGAISCPQTPPEISALKKNLGSLIEEIQSSPQCAPIVAKIQAIESHLQQSSIVTLIASTERAPVRSAEGSGAVAKLAVRELSAEQFESVKSELLTMIEQVFQTVTLASQGQDCGLKVRKMVYAQMSDIIQSVTHLSSQFVGPYGVPLQVGSDMISAVLLAMGRGWSLSAFDMKLASDREFFTKNLCAYSEFYRRVDAVVESQESRATAQDVKEETEKYVSSIEKLCQSRLKEPGCERIKSEISELVASRKEDKQAEALQAFVGKNKSALHADILLEWYRASVAIEIASSQMHEQTLESLGPGFAELIDAKRPIDDLYYQEWSPRYLSWLLDVAHGSTPTILLPMVQAYLLSPEGRSCVAHADLGEVSKVVACIKAQKEAGAKLNSIQNGVLREVRALSQLTDLYNHYCDFFEEVQVKTGSLRYQCNDDRRARVVRQVTASVRSSQKRRALPKNIAASFSAGATAKQKVASSAAAASPAASFLRVTGQTPGSMNAPSTRAAVKQNLNNYMLYLNSVAHK